MSTELIILTHDTFINDLSDLEEVLVPYRANNKKSKVFFYIGTQQSHIILEIIFDPQYGHEFKTFYFDENKECTRLGEIKAKYPTAFIRYNLIPSHYFDGNFLEIPENYRPRTNSYELTLERNRIERKRIEREGKGGRETLVLWGVALVIGIGLGVGLGVGTAGVGLLAILIGIVATLAVVSLYHFIKNKIQKSKNHSEDKKDNEIPADIEPELTHTIEEVVSFMIDYPHRALYFMSPAAKGARDFRKELAQNPRLIDAMVLNGDEKLLHAIKVSGLYYQTVSQRDTRIIQAQDILSSIQSVNQLRKMKQFNLLGDGKKIDDLFDARIDYLLEEEKWMKEDSLQPKNNVRWEMLPEGFTVTASITDESQLNAFIDQCRQAKASEGLNHIVIKYKGERFILDVVNPVLVSTMPEVLVKFVEELRMQLPDAPVGKAVDYIIANPAYAINFFKDITFQEKIRKSPAQFIRLVQENNEFIFYSIRKAQLFEQGDRYAIDLIYDSRVSLELLKTLEDKKLLGLSPIVESSLDNRILKLEDELKYSTATDTYSRVAAQLPEPKPPKHKEEADEKLDVIQIPEGISESYSNARNKFEQGKVQEAFQLFTEMADKIQSDMSSVLMSVANAVGRKDWLDKMMADTFYDMDNYSIAARRLKDAVMSLTKNQTLQGPPIFQLFMLEREFKRKKHDNADQYLALLAQCKDEPLAMRLMLTSELLHDKSNREAKKQAVKLFPLEKVIVHLQNFPEDAWLVLDKEKGFFDAFVHHPILIKKMIEDTGADLHEVMDRLNMVRVACEHTKDEKSSLYLLKMFSNVLEKDRSQVLGRG